MNHSDHGEVKNNILAPIDTVSDTSEQEPPLESLVLLIITERFDDIRKTTRRELEELQEGQDAAADLNHLLKAINKATDDHGGLDLSKEPALQELLEKVQERLQTIEVDGEAGKFDLEIDQNKVKYNRDERVRLTDNIQNTIDMLNFKNDRQLRTLNELTNERYEMYQMARTILKPLHDAKIAHARGIKGG